MFAISRLVRVFAYENVPTGATGAAGATILGSYDTWAAFIAAHPTGTVGDAYLVGGELYVWNGTQWQSMGRIIGPTGATGSTGATGAAGATILGSYDTWAAFIAAHPTGTVGDAYLVGGVLYVWDGTTGSWRSLGSIIGPTGPADVRKRLRAFFLFASIIVVHCGLGGRM